MTLTYIPTLHMQREIYRIPAGMDRFRQYLRTMTGEEGTDLLLPFAGMNPMAKEHIPVLLDRLLAMDADGEGARAAAASHVSLPLRITTVLADDLKGGWTNRWAAEYSDRFEQEGVRKRGWIVATLWSSEEPSLARVRESVLAAAHRAAWVAEHGRPVTLDDCLRQEGYALMRAGHTLTLAPEEIHATREILRDLRDRADMPTTVAALFGDVAAEALGFTKLGLPPGAGLHLAIAES